MSYIKARQTGLWHVAPDGTEVERIGAPGEPRYDAALIRGQIAAFEAYDRGWESWFASQGIVPLRIRYQALAEDPARVLADVCGALGVKAPEPGQIEPRVASLRMLRTRRGSHDIGVRDTAERIGQTRHSRFA